ncbi:hypothetical protein FWH58_03250 [Candidatus Saccharibacteria bacterium]|nr:hypothetical protein [Candidatus Saccharibacteria bacterium]
MSEKQLTTGVRKRQQIADTNKQMMIYVAAAAAVVTVCVMLAINFWQRISYQMTVNSEWSATNKVLRESLENIPILRENVEALSANSNVKSIQGLVDPELDKWQVVFDVLPSSCDTLAVEYAFFNIIFKPSGLGAGIRDVNAVMEGGNCEAIGLIGSGGGADTSGLLQPPVVTMRIGFELVNASDSDIEKALLSMEYSLHPITVQSVEINSDENRVRSAKILVVTYFIPKASWQWGEKTIPVDSNAAPAASGGTTP